MAFGCVASGERFTHLRNARPPATGRAERQRASVGVAGPPEVLPELILRIPGVAHEQRVDTRSAVDDRRLAVTQKAAGRAGKAGRAAAGPGAERRGPAGKAAGRAGKAGRAAAGPGAERRGPAGKAAGAGPTALPMVLPPGLAATPPAKLGTKEVSFCSAAGAAGTGLAAMAGGVTAGSVTAGAAATDAAATDAAATGAVATGSTVVCGTPASFTAAGTTTGVARIRSRLSRNLSMRGVEAGSNAAGAALLDRGARADSSPGEGCSAASRRAIKRFRGSVVGCWPACVSSPVSEGTGAPAPSPSPETRPSSPSITATGVTRARRSGAAFSPASEA